MRTLERLYTEEITIEVKRTNDLGEEEVERRTRKQSLPFLDIVAKGLNPNHLVVDILIDIAWIGLLDENPDLSREDARLLTKYDFKELPYVMKQIETAVIQSLGITREELEQRVADFENKGNVKPEEAEKNKIGTGKSSKSSDADSSN